MTDLVTPIPNGVAWARQCPFLAHISRGVSPIKTGRPLSRSGSMPRLSQAKPASVLINLCRGRPDLAALLIAAFPRHISATPD